jgi:hypothetical protein
LADLHGECRRCIGDAHREQRDLRPELVALFGRRRAGALVSLAAARCFRRHRVVLSIRLDVASEITKTPRYHQTRVRARDDLVRGTKRRERVFVVPRIVELAAGFEGLLRAGTLISLRRLHVTRACAHGGETQCSTQE